MKIYNKIILAIALLFMISSCSKNRLNENSSGVLTADQLFKTKEGFENALNGLYAEVRRYRSGNTLNDINNIMNVQAVIGVDNAYGNWRDPQLDVFNLWKNLNNSAFSQYSRVFGWLYETINAANTIVDRSANPAVNWTDAEKNRIVAEARLVRAWCYRHLTYLWGDVPLTLTESRSTNIRTDWERTPRVEVRNAMKEDLLFAEQHLPDVGASDAKLIKGIAQHFLSELYLALGDYTNAKAMALKVINNPNYKLITARFGVRSAQPGTPFTDMFIDGNARRSQGNTEALWVIQNELLTAGGEGNTIMRRYWVNRYYSFTIGSPARSPFAVSVENGGRGLGRLSPTRWAMNLYQAGDDRGSAFAWRYYYLINNQIPNGTNPRTGQPYRLGDTIFLNSTSNETLSQANWPSTRKWDYAQAPPQELVDREYNDQVFLRVGETYLLLAEACIGLNDAQGAADAINVLRTRAHAPQVTAAQMNIDFILDERSRELFSEEDRRYVLLRTGKWLERTKLYNKIASPNVVARDTLLPIPQDVIDANLTRQMPQNPGY